MPVFWESSPLKQQDPDRAEPMNMQDLSTKLHYIVLYYIMHAYV